MISVRLPFWLRIVVLVAALCIVAGAGLFTYRYFTHPTTLTVAAGSLDGEAVHAMSAIASRLTETNAPVRLNVIDTGNVVDATKAFSAGNVDLAVVRGDVGDLSQARAVAIVAHAVVLITAPPGSPIDSVTGLKGHTVGVMGGELNRNVVAALTQEYNLDPAKVSFKDVAPADAGKALKNKQVGALLVAIPLTEKYLALFRSLVQPNAKATPVLVPIESAGAIAQTHGAYESFDVPKGTLRGSPPVPEDDLTTLRVSFYLVAQKKLDSDLIASLTQSFMNARRDLHELPILAQVTAASTDQDSYIPVHPGAAAFYNGNVQSFMDKYSNAIYLTPMILGALATVAAAAWKFLGLGKENKEGVLDSLYSLARQARNADSEAALSDIEEEIDSILKAQLAKTAAGDEDAIDAGTLNLAAHRLDNLIHYRRSALAIRQTRAPAA